MVTSLSIQWRIVSALLLREMLTRYGRHNIGFLWIFVEPMLFTLGVAAIWTFLGASHGHFPIIAFAITGYSSVLLWRNMPNRTIGAIGPNLQLLYHRNVKIIDVFVSRILLEAGGASISFSTLAVLFSFAGIIAPPEDLLTVATGWLLIAWFGASLALLAGALAERFESIERVWHIATYVLFPISGAAFNVDALPEAGRAFVLAFPMVHGVELVREGYFGSAFHAHYDLPYMMSCNIALTFAGLLATIRISENLNPE